MPATPCAVPPDAMSVVPGADFADAYATEVHGHHGALELTQQIFTRGPRWMGPLMGLRNAMVRPFGLKTAVAPNTQTTPAVGFFPVIEASESRAVLGLDDKHLDFRLVADAQPLENGNTRLVLSTVIKRHNGLGRVYFALVLPFHRRIVPLFLNRAGG